MIAAGPIDAAGIEASIERLRVLVAMTADSGQRS
jgi:hypothetical protein